MASLILLIAQGAAAERIEDMADLRNIVGLLATGAAIPVDKTGRVDVYALVREGEVIEQYVSLFASKRFDYGPTWKEARKGDYTKFPFVRFKGDPNQQKQVPLLWDKQPDERNGRLVAWSGGSVKWYPEAEIRELLLRFRQIPPTPPK